MEIGKLIINSIWVCKGLKIAMTILKKVNKARGLTVPDIKA